MIIISSITIIIMITIMIIISSNEVLLCLSVFPFTRGSPEVGGGDSSLDSQERAVKNAARAVARTRGGHGLLLLLLSLLLLLLLVVVVAVVVVVVVVSYISYYQC